MPCSVGEDLDLNNRIASLKKPKYNHPRNVVQNVEGSAIYQTSTRRAVKAFVNGSSITSQWSDKKTKFSVLKNREIRSSSKAELIKKLKRHRNSIPNELIMLEDLLMNEITFGQRYSAVDWHAVVKRFAWQTGIKMKLDCDGEEIIGVKVNLGSYARFRARF